MKCQCCSQPATYHITEMTDDHPVELHFCEKHAHEYLHKEVPVVSVANSQSQAVGSTKGKKKGGSLQKATNDLVEADFQSCPYCGLGFQEFRKTGRLGCPEDYTCFSEHLEPLLFSIHGDTEHVGKRPLKYIASDQRSLLVRLRHELDDAVSVEDYEKASRLRDRIKAIESQTV